MGKSVRLSADGCVKNDTMTVSVNGSAPTANFTFTPTCLGNITQFSNLSVSTDTSSIISWQWDFGDPSSGLNNTST